MYCQKCGKEIMDEAVVCIHCGCATGNNTLETQQTNAQKAAKAHAQAKSAKTLVLVATVLFAVALVVFFMGGTSIETTYDTGNKTYTYTSSTERGGVVVYALLIAEAALLIFGLIIGKREIATLEKKTGTIYWVLSTVILVFSFLLTLSLLQFSFGLSFLLITIAAFLQIVAGVKFGSAADVNG